MPAEYADCKTLLDLHHKMNVGLPVHLYGEVYKIVYDDSVRIETKQYPDGYDKIITHAGRQRHGSGAGSVMPGESPSRVEYSVKTIEDLKVIEYTFTHRKLVPTYEKVKKAIDEMGDFGFVDLVLPRSPMPHLIIDLANLENGLYLMADHPEECEHFFQVCSEANDVAFDLMADCPYGNVCIFGDNIDEVMVSPSMFKQYSLPYYQRRCERLHKGGKLVSAAHGRPTAGAAADDEGHGPGHLRRRDARADERLDAGGDGQGTGAEPAALVRRASHAVLRWRRRCRR